MLPGLIGLPVGGFGNDQLTRLLLHLNGVDGTTSFPDSSRAAHSIIAGGNAQLDVAQAKFGGAALLLDGNADYIRLSGTSTNLALGTGDFTIDFWVRWAALSADDILIDWRPTATQGLYITLYVDASGNLTFFANAANRIVASTSFLTGAWYHVAVTRAGGTTRLFIDGQQEGGNYADANNYLSPADRPAIGSSGFSLGTLTPSAWLDEFRISKGIARWTANFTPPSQEYT